MYKNFIKQLAFVSSEYSSKKFLLAISGGVDSMVLFHLFQKAALSFEVLHCNFQLRDEDSEQDQILVEEICVRYNIKYTTKRFETNQLAQQPGESLQMIARKIRYEWFAEMQNSKNADYIVTAHHLSDQIETVLFNLVRGTGISGMRGMLALSATTLRPLLQFTKDEIYQYAKTENISWREDISNKSDKYKRNFIRNQIIPLLKNLNPNFESTFSQTIDKFNHYETLIKEIIPFIELKEEKSAFFLSDFKLKEQNNPIYWYESTKKFGFNFDQAKILVDNVYSETQSGKKIISSTGYLLLKVHQGWELSKITKTEFKAIEFASVDDENIQNYLSFNPISSSEVNFGLGAGVAFLDAQKIIFPLTLRPWKEGDRFIPFGLNGSKKVSDYLINQKISLTEKENILVLEDAEQEIIWLVGHRLSQKCSLTNQTTHIVKISSK